MVQYQFGLFRVASSLDSMVLGEPQILGQLKSATRMSKELGYSGNNLDYLSKGLQKLEIFKKVGKICHYNIKLSRSVVGFASYISNN